MGRKKHTEEKSRVLNVLEKEDSVIAAARNIRYSRKAIIS